MFNVTSPLPAGSLSSADGSSVFSASSAVAAAVADEFHCAFPAVVAVMLHVEAVIRYRQTPGVDKVELHWFALVVHAGLQGLARLQALCLEGVLLAVLYEYRSGLHEAGCDVS